MELGKAGVYVLRLHGVASRGGCLAGGRAVTSKREVSITLTNVRGGRTGVAKGQV